MAKRKESQIKVIRHFSAGGAVFRKNHNLREWLLIKPKGTKRWQLPKGKIDRGEKSADTAIREIFEETGVRAQILEKIEDIKYFFVQDTEKIFKVVVFYLMKSTDGKDTKIEKQWEDEIEEAVWVLEEEALKKLSFKSEKEVLEKGIGRVSQVV
ncbi:MAG: AP4A hydrolase [Microgenomates group bacterium Gr01-1014_5]|nr:MAG: AP4A hydrolase [Microgenomates group bacterium Gr01-1014_5]